MHFFYVNNKMLKISSRSCTTFENKPRTQHAMHCGCDDSFNVLSKISVSNIQCYSLLTFDSFPVYESQFSRTLSETRNQEPYLKKVVGNVSLLLALSLGLFALCRMYRKYLTNINVFCVYIA